VGRALALGLEHETKIAVAPIPTMRYSLFMPERSRKRPRDLNALAASIVSDATGEENPEFPGP